MRRPERIEIVEVGPRDGLQNESVQVATADKIRFVDLLSAAGFREIEVSSFVSARWIPQLADAAEVFAAIKRAPGVTYSALVPNEAGLERALAADVGKVAIFVAASESFSRRNINASIGESLERVAPVIRAAAGARIPVRGYVSCVVACPFEGPIDPGAVGAVVGRLLDLGVDEIDLGETIGVAVPDEIERLYAALAPLIAPERTTLHLHDTRGTALACVDRALALGVRRFDASCAGLGGCPYAPGASGNLATEDLVYFCERSSIATGVDRAALRAAGRHIAAALGRTPPGRVFRAEEGAEQGVGGGPVAPRADAPR
ncbi:MAG TPA: hydroxymethylglutaryl-CoA lyase [Phycisphaerales bacterium]|nr:hydroxymethylglutaryl-CoA lyase [Phycisphaerales bacterium]HMP37567.1 hydroxymethylglutaryl-CoA lyase [Phycisphaerales bacterium]